MAENEERLITKGVPGNNNNNIINYTQKLGSCYNLGRSPCLLSLLMNLICTATLREEDSPKLSNQLVEPQFVEVDSIAEDLLFTF